MTVLLVNGSPHEHGCTDAALKHAASVLEEQGVHTEIFWIGSKPISGCIGCGACKKASCKIRVTVSVHPAGLLVRITIS